MERMQSKVKYENVCRLCLSSRGETQPIFSSGSNSDDPEPPVLASLIEECVSVKINESDDLPTQICKKCVTNVNNWHLFKKVCNDAQVKLRDWIKDAHAQVVNIKEEPLMDDSVDEDMVIDASYPDVSFPDHNSEFKLQPEGPPILASLGLAPRNEKENEDDDDEDNSGDEEVERIVPIKKNLPITTAKRILPAAEMASKDCLLCGRSYHYSHNARRHELLTHNYDRYTNRYKSPSPPPIGKLRPNPLNPKARLLPNPINPKIQMMPKNSHKITSTAASSSRRNDYPVRIRSLSDLQRNDKQPQILKSLLTRKPEILVSEPQIMRSRSESPETLVSEPELSAFQVETIISEPDTYINNSGDSEEDEDDQYDESMADGEFDEEVEISPNLDINKIIGVESQEQCIPRKPQVKSAEQITPDVHHETDEDVQNGISSEDEGEPLENSKPYTGDENINDMNENNANDENAERINEIPASDDQENNEDFGNDNNKSDDGGQDYQEEEYYDDDLPPVPLAPIVEINENIENDHENSDNDIPNEDEHVENEQVENENVDNNIEKENEIGIEMDNDIDVENNALSEHIDIKEISLPSVTMTPIQKSFIIKYRDVIEQVNTLKCKCCNRTHSRRKAVIQHLQKNNLKVPKHTCYRCVITFGHIGALLSHMRANVCTDLWKIIYEEGGIPDNMVCESNSNTEVKEAPAETFNKSQYKDILNSRSYACKLCPAKFQLKQFIMKHVLDVHENGGQRIPLCCIHCKYRFKDNKIWKRHIRNGECTVNIACEICNEKFRSLQHFSEHALSVHVGEAAEQSSENVNRSVDERRTECPICHKTANTYQNLVKHLKTIHNEEKPHMCQHCDSKFESVTEFNHHIYKEHSDRVPNGDAEQMMEQFSEDQVDLSIVKQEVTTYNYSCTDCASMFDTVDGWTQHQIDAHNHQAYECDQCDKKFLQDSELIDHKNAHLRVKFYSCTVCANSYSSPQRLSEHMMKAHPEESSMSNDAENPFYCGLCVRSFKNRQAYSNHMRIHAKVQIPNKKAGSGEKPMKKFVPQPVSYNITYRNSPKSTDAPYSCDICGKGFLHKKNIWKHKKVLHPEEARRIELEKAGAHFMNASTEEDDFSQNQNSTGLSIPQFDSFTSAAYEESESNINMNDGTPHEYQCDLCDKKFAVKSSIWKHKRVKHGIVNYSLQEENAKSENRASCTICKLNFTDKKAYYRHRKTVHRVNVQACKICGKALNSTLELYEHYKASHAKELLGYNASQGNSNKSQVESQSSRDLRSEEYDEDSDRADQYQARYPCDSCGKTFLGMMALQNHACIRQNTSSGEKFDCEICNKSYTSISALKSHRGWHLRSPDGKAAFSSSGLWMPHNKLTTKVSKFEVREPPTVKHSTPIIEPGHLQIKRKLPPDVQMTLLKKKKLSDEVTVELVQTVPRGESSKKTPYEEVRTCNLCGKEFTTKAAFVRHMDEVHRPNSVFCPICNKSFTRKSTLLVHMQKHGIMTDNARVDAEEHQAREPERYYSCDLCNVRYTTAKSLRRHCVKHHNIAAEDVIEEGGSVGAGAGVVGTRVVDVGGGSRHRCGQCGEVFSSDRDMWQHRHYSCNQCGMFFSRQQYLSAHMKARHHEHADNVFFPCNMCDRFYMNKKSLQRHIESAH